MTVFTFLDTDALVALSETDRGCNSKCFSFLVLGLKRALTPGAARSDEVHRAPHSERRISSLVAEYPNTASSGLATVRTFATLNREEAEATVNDFLCTAMPVSSKRPCSYGPLYVSRILYRSAYASTYCSNENDTVPRERKWSEVHDSFERIHDALYTEGEWTPRGFVGLYGQAVDRTRKQVTLLLKERRRKRYLSLPEEEQRVIGCSFIDACGSDEKLSVVRDLVEVRETIDVDGNYTGSNGVNFRAVHMSAFSEANKVLEYLCRGALGAKPSKGGGLCDLDTQDENGWTALHFAVSAGSVESIRILVAHGADLTIQAANGCTPLQWAAQLHRDELVEELRFFDSEKGRKRKKNEEFPSVWLDVQTTDFDDCESILCAQSNSLKLFFSWVVRVYR